MSRGRARLDAIIRLARTGPEPRIDVGADHGRVASALGAIATEREPHRAGTVDGRWVVCDGLAPFRDVGTAVIAGMGARTIARILGSAPPVRCAVLHAQDDAEAIRVWLAGHGWRITDEALAPDGRGFAEILRVEPGAERATGLELAYGPRLLERGDPLLAVHLERALRVLEGLLAEPLPADRRAEVERRSAFVAARLTHARGRDRA